MNLNRNLVIGKDTYWSELGLSAVETKVLTGELLNLPLESVTEGGKPLGEILADNQLAEQRYLDLLRQVLPLLDTVRKPFARSGAIYFYQHQAVQAVDLSPLHQWQYHDSLALLKRAETVVFCDQDQSWNLSAALAFYRNGVGEARVWVGGC